MLSVMSLENMWFQFVHDSTQKFRLWVHGQPQIQCLAAHQNMGYGQNLHQFAAKHGIWSEKNPRKIWEQPATLQIPQAQKGNVTNNQENFV